jgi:excisionase family DNA binding protein
MDGVGVKVVFSVPEAARLLGISRGHAYAKVHQGVLGHVRLGRRIVVPRVVLEELLGDRFDAAEADAEAEGRSGTYPGAYLGR